MAALGSKAPPALREEREMQGQGRAERTKEVIACASSSESSFSCCLILAIDWLRRRLTFS